MFDFKSSLTSIRHKIANWISLFLLSFGIDDDESEGKACIEADELLPSGKAILEASANLTRLSCSKRPSLKTDVSHCQKTRPQYLDSKSAQR